MAQQEAELSAVRNLLLELREVTTMRHVPPDVARRAGELLDAAIKLTDDVIAKPTAASLGQRGGLKTAERGPEYFRQIAAQRKTRAGGRPKKKPGGIEAAGDRG